jgi:2-oxoglutarate dehydrogenase E2 component (dihydrolipoamide succinyltransferase)
MSTELKIPQLPESVADAIIATWHKRPGDAVAQDENVVDIETDKVMLEVPAPHAGVLAEIREDEGATVIAGQVIGLLDEAAAAGAAAPEKAAEPTAAKEAPAQSPAAAAPEPAAPPAQPSGTPAMSPSVRRLVTEHGLDPSTLAGSGKGGRIIKEDVVSELARQESESTGQDERPERRVPMTRLRARIAERLLEAQHNAAMLTTFNEVNMAPVMGLRKRYKDRFEKQHGVRLGFMSFFVKACVEGLKRYPEVNASIDGTDIVYHGFYDIGVAVSSPRGLVVPILRDADRVGMADIERHIADFGERARENNLTLDELTGGTFTISNGGVFGSLLSTPILNPPQSGILGMHKIEERPVVEDGQVVVRPMMYLALSYDHRLIDGASAVRFLVTVKELLEDPARMMLEV